MRASTMARAAGAGIVMVALVLAVLAYSGGRTAMALAAFWNGSLGTTDAFLSGTLVRAIPLTIVGVGLAIAFRAWTAEAPPKNSWLITASPSKALTSATIRSQAVAAVACGCRIPRTVWVAHTRSWNVLSMCCSSCTPTTSRTARQVRCA